MEDQYNNKIHIELDLVFHASSSSAKNDEQ